MESGVTIIVSLIWGIVCGCITKSMSSNKGYDGGFWWGFFLSIIGIIVVACKPDLNAIDAAAEAARRSVEYNGSRSYDRNSEASLPYSSGSSYAARLNSGASHWNCPDCKTSNEPDAMFCKHCGAKKKTAWVCTHCNVSNGADANFCKQCGATREEAAKPDEQKKTAYAAPANASEDIPNIPEEVFPVKSDDGTHIKCPICGTVQRADRHVCFKCGVRFAQQD